MDGDTQRAEVHGNFSDSYRNSHSSTSSWSSQDPPPPPHHHINFDSQRGGFSSDGNRHQRNHHYHQSHRHHSNQRYNHQQNFNSEQIDSVAGGGTDNNSGRFGRKREFSQSGNSVSSDCSEGGSFVKLYVAGIPTTTTEDEIHSLFEKHGKIVEVVRIKDKSTGQPHESGFVKYATLEEADRAIGALHNKYTFPAGVVAIKVRYADGKRERLGVLGSCNDNYKLYVGCLNKQASRMEIEEIFSSYGPVENVHIVLDEGKQSRGYGFVQFCQRDMAVAAVNGLNGTYIMRGCDRPLIVRFADQKKPRIGEPRPAPYFNDQKAGHPPSPKAMSSSFKLSPGSSFFPSTSDPLDCDWSEHSCPDGYKYYYNCSTCESRWEKPEEYLLFEQRVQKQRQMQQQRSSPQHELYHMQIQATSIAISPTCV